MSKPKLGIPARPSSKTECWYTREGVIDLLGISEHTVTNWMRKGILNPLREVRACSDGREREVFVFDPRELLAAPTPRRRNREEMTPGEVAAKAFGMFSDGAKQQDVVVATHAEPEKIRELHETWLDMGGADFVITPAARTALERMLGPITDIVELVEKIRARVSPESDVVCPGPDCPMCSGAACNLCDCGPGTPRCEHATDERHRVRAATP